MNFDGMNEDSLEKPEDENGKHATRQENVRKADFLVDGKESRCGHEDSWNVYKGRASKIIKNQG